ncbi:unnamed protein product [Prunus brigantina]
MASSSTSLASSLPNVSYLVSIKLDRTNYLLWLAQFTPLLQANDLYGYVDGSETCPAKLLDDKSTPNPAYATWQRQDKQIMSWINSTLTPTVLSTVARCTTSAEVWKSLATRYASQSRSRTLQLKFQLQSTRRGNMSITAYIDKLTSIADQLSLAGKAPDDEDLIEIILNGVGPAYESAVNSIKAREKSMMLDDVLALLLSAESRLEDSNSLLSDSTSTALYTTTSQGRSRGSGFHDRSSGSSSFGRTNSGRGNNSHTFDSYDHSNQFGGRGFSRGQGGSYYGVFHGSNRGNEVSGGFTNSFGRGILPNHHSAHGNSLYGGFSRPKRVCYNCGDPRHLANNCSKPKRFYESRHSSAPSRALVATPSAADSNDTWYTDSGASSHITHDLANLRLPTAYTGQDQVSVGNGAGSLHGEDAFPRQE